MRDTISDDLDDPASERIAPKTARRMMAYVVRRPLLLWGGIAFVLIGTGMALWEPRLIGLAVDEALVPRDRAALHRIGAMFFVVACARVVAMIAQGLIFERLGQEVMQEVRVELFTHLQSLPVSAFNRNPVGRLVTRVTNDVSSMAEMFASGSIMILTNALIVFGTFIWLFVLDWRLALIVAAVFPPLIWASVYFSGRLRESYRAARSRLSALNSFLAENILGMKVIYLFDRGERHARRFGAVNERYAEAQVGTVRIFAYFQPTITAFAGLAVAFVIYYGGESASAGGIRPGLLVAFFSYVLAMFQPLREISDKWNIFLAGMAGAERIFAILDWKAELPPDQLVKPASSLEGVRGHVVFDRVWFAYDGENWVLRDFSLEVMPGMSIGVVGHTGAGKTTLISLLLRFHDPQRGRILLDGRDLREYDLRSLRATIGIVQQDVFLFSGSVEENVALWRPDADDRIRRVEAAFGALNLRRQRILDERGANLSAGERQVLAFARACCADPSLWILDEATANVDSTSEKRLEAALDAVSKGRTRILIAHRLATVKNCDRILVLHKGALLEAGTHDELLRADGAYTRLYRYQSSIDAQPGLSDSS